MTNPFWQGPLPPTPTPEPEPEPVLPPAPKRMTALERDHILNDTSDANDVRWWEALGILLEDRRAGRP